MDATISFFTVIGVLVWLPGAPDATSTPLQSHSTTTYKDDLQQGS